MSLIELNILNAIQSIRFPAFDWLMVHITYLGNWGIFYSILTILLLMFKKTRLAGFVCATALIIDFIVVNAALKPLISRVRPYEFNAAVILLVPHQPDASFPSGHTALSFAFAAAVTRLGRKFAVGAYILASLIAFSRLYLYLHYPSDVLAGIIIGIACGFIARFIWKKILAKKN